MNEQQKLTLKMSTSNFIEVWRDYCQMHTQLYDLTCEEYVQLLGSDIENLENIIEQKNKLLDQIKLLDQKRMEIISSDFELKLGVQFEKLSELSSFLRSEDLRTEAKQLDNLNSLLLDIIEKIQDQNKKNQFYLNKAIISLKELKEGFSGTHKYKTYGANGTTRSIGQR